MKLLRLCLIVLVLLVSSIPAFAKVVYVNATGNDANDGLSWSAAKKTVQAGINAAVSGDEVWVAKGIYNQDIILNAGISLYGGFLGNEASKDQRDCKINTTTLRNTSWQSHTITVAQGADTNTIVDGFNIQPSVMAYCTGINCTGSSPTIINNTFNGTYWMVEKQGAVTCINSSPVITGNTFINNTGNTVFCQNASPVISNNTMISNNVRGIHCEQNSSPLISNNKIIGTSGTAINCVDSSPTISGNTITDSSPGITCTNSSPNIFNNVISGSKTSGINCSNSSPEIHRNTIKSNGANQSHGGGIYCHTGSPIIHDNFIYANFSANGGGIFCAVSSPIISNNTIAGNYAPNGGGINLSQTDSISIVSNNIIAFNSSGICNTGGDPVLKNNCLFNPAGYDLSGISKGEGDILADPNFASVEYGRFHIQPGSPCIDAGDDTAVQQSWLDIDGQSHNFGTHVDIGADEFYGAPTDSTPMIIYVKPAGDDANNGTSWESAKKTVQAGIDAASTLGGEVWVAGGTYKERLILKSYTSIYGGFSGRETSKMERNRIINPTVLDGEGKGTVVSAMYYGVQPNTVDGFTIQNGKGTSDQNSGRGGVYCYKSPLIINNNLITKNYSDDVTNCGGIVCEYTSYCSITNNTISNNYAYMGTGGGIISLYSYTTVSNNLIVENYGAGIVCSESGIGHVVISNNRISGNQGGIGCGNATTIINNTITKNGSVKGGVGLSISSGSPQIINNIIAFNTSGIYGYFPENPILKNNCVYNPDGYDYSGLSAGDGDIQKDPKLVAVELGKVHIQPNSPCKDAGDDSAVQPGWTDMDNHARISGTHVDIGADESDGTDWDNSPSVIHVSTDGNDNYDGLSWETAKQTVQAGIDAAAALGGEVWVAEGSYYGTINLRSYASLYGGFTGTETSRKERNSIDNKTILDGEGKSLVVSAKFLAPMLPTIDGFTIQNGNNINGGGIYCNNSSPIISNNLITSNLKGGILCGIGSPLIKNNLIQSNDIGISCRYSSSLIYNNTVRDNTSVGIGCTYSTCTIDTNLVEANGGGVSCSGSTASKITNNTIKSNSGSGVSLESPGFIHNNVIADNGTDGVYYKGSTGVFELSNNTIIGSKSRGVYLYCTGSPTINVSNNIIALSPIGLSAYRPLPVLKNNNVFNPTGSNYSGVTPGVGDISADPLFIDKANGDYHLKPTSLCIDAGDPNGDYSGQKDMDCGMRVSGPRVDIGADEWGLDVTGTINLESFEGNLAECPVTVQLMQGGDLLDTEIFFLSENPGTFTLHNVYPGIYDIGFKGTHWLRKILPNVQIPNNP